MSPASLDPPAPDAPLEVDLRGERYRDQVRGCWVGKNAGGTLGTPVEKGWGEPEPFDIWWYPELRDGGLPNDDLEMQLVWLTALREVGPGLTAADLARYWLDHIGYNFDEYGLSKANLRLGLQPPVSGAWNNWFVDCMGCPIRSEVWACVAPGAPRIAARYAYEDGICDHAGGESVYGELFNVAVQSSAFVVSDPELLLDIASSYVPTDSATARAIGAARRAHADGLTWQQARQRVLEATPHEVAQYSPINLGFQVIGWLYGRDFGEAMCITVNCGYDTDSSGGSIGSWLGIRAGLTQLPTRWVEPFGIGISTNEDWGGVRHLTDGTTDVPTDVEQLTTLVGEQAVRVLTHHGRPLDGGVLRTDLAELYADASIEALWHRPVWTVRHHDPQLDVAVDYRGDASIRPGETRTLGVTLINPHPDPVVVELLAQGPAGWSLELPPTVELPAAGADEVELTVTPGDRGTIDNANVITVAAQPVGYPRVRPVEVSLVGSAAWRVRTGTLDDAAQASDWRTASVAAHELPLTRWLADASGGPLVAQTFLHCARPRRVQLVIEANVHTTAVIGGSPLIQYDGPRRVRPSYHAVDAVATAPVDLPAGFTEVLFEFRATGDGRSPEGFFYLCEPDRLRTGITTVGRTRFPEDTSR